LGEQAGVGADSGLKLLERDAAVAALINFNN
jgi:hypothetical protein